MFNSFKSSTFSYFFHTFKAGYYELAWNNDVEETYFNGNEVVVFVKDEKIGSRIYETIKHFLQNEIVIACSDFSFKFNKFYVSNENVVQAFSLNVDFAENINWKSLSRMRKVELTIKFIYEMRKNLFSFDEEFRFCDEACNNISTFLRCFKVGIQNMIPDGCLVEYVHSKLSNGESLNEFYQKILEKPICQMGDFPYSLAIIRMCYDYYAYNIIPENILEVLEEAKSDEAYMTYFGDALLSSGKDLASNYNVIKETAYYTIYSGNIKFYRGISEDFADFLMYSIKKTILFSRYLNENSKKLIFDFQGKVIGQKFSVEDEQAVKISEIKYENFADMWEFLKKLKKVIKGAFCYISVHSDSESDFILEDTFVKIGDSIYFCDIEHLYQMLTASKYNSINKQIVALFFKMYQEILVKKYGNITSRNELFSKFEIKYMNPVIATEFVNFLLGQEVDYNVAAEHFEEYLETAIWGTNKKYVYDAQFHNIPGSCLRGRNPEILGASSPVDFYFDYEIAEKFNGDLNRGASYNLPDGRKVVLLKRLSENTIDILRSREQNNEAEFIRKISRSAQVDLVKINKIIFSTALNDNGTYQVVGYITDPIKGEYLTDELLLGLNNRDLLRVFAKCFANIVSDDNYVVWKSVQIDEKFNVYVDLTSKSFQIKRRKASKNQSFLKWIANYLVEKGYNPNAFVGIELDKDYRLNSLLASRMTKYCDEHKIYFDENESMCPVCSQTLYMVPKGFVKTSRIVFEDMDAIHYSIDENHNLKVYKDSCHNKKQIESNVEDIVAKCLVDSSYTEKLGQNGFVPLKKAINQSKKFVGYVYETCECIDLRDTKNMSNMHRVKGLLRLMMQVDNVTNQGKYGFIQNPFSYVFVSKNHKKQVQIVNIELLKPNTNLEATINWTMEYVKDSLIIDSAIDVSGLENVETWKELFNWLETWTKVNTKRCPIHRIFYSQDMLVCPHCVSKEFADKIPVEKMSEEMFNAKEWAKEPIGEGGESFIYGCNSRTVAKKFKQDEIDKNFKTIVLAKIMSKSEKIRRINEENNGYEYIIPRTLIVDSSTQDIFAYYMDRVNGCSPISSLKDKAIVDDFGLTQKDILEILISVGKGIERLHEIGIFIGDLNGRNILFDPQSKKVFFLDFDGMGVDEISPMFCTDEYIDPVSKKNCNITWKDDWYSFAVQVFHYLTYTHPFNGMYYENVEGKRVALKIPAKMERRISLLGNHGMQPPAIAVSWEWMSRELTKKFLNIFEGNERTSIVPELMKQYARMYGQEVPSSPRQVIRVNDKFVAIEVNEFGNDKVIRVINDRAVICENAHGKRYLTVIGDENADSSKKWYELNADCKGILDVLFTKESKIAWVVYKDEFWAFYLNDGTKPIYRANHRDVRNVVAAGEALYYIQDIEDGNVIFKASEAKLETTEFLRADFTQMHIYKFLAKSDRKFIMVVKESETRDAIYCNTQKFYTFTCKTASRRYNIVYDKFSKKWLVINSEGEVIIIDENSGNYVRVSDEVRFENIEVDNISFRKSTIYIPDENQLHIISVKDRIKVKSMGCHKIMSSSARLYDINQDGFSVITADNAFYKVRKG